MKLGAGLEGLFKFLRLTARSVSSKNNNPAANSGFSQVLKNVSGKSQRPVALVKTDREVSFQGMKFINHTGANISIDKLVSNGKTHVKVNEQNRWVSKKIKNDDPLLKQELRLSGNTGVVTVVPDFQKIVRKHLKDTRPIRRDKMRNRLNTPMRPDDSILKGFDGKLLSSSLSRDDSVSRARTLASLGMKMARMTGNSSMDLKAVENSLNLPRRWTRLGKSTLTPEELKEMEIQAKEAMDEVKKSLPHPLSRRVRRFEPKKLARDSLVAELEKDVSKELNGKRIELSEKDLKTTGNTPANDSRASRIAGSINVLNNPVVKSSPGKENQRKRNLLQALQTAKESISKSSKKNQAIQDESKSFTRKVKTQVKNNPANQTINTIQNISESQQQGVHGQSAAVESDLSQVLNTTAKLENSQDTGLTSVQNRETESSAGKSQQNIQNLNEILEKIRGKALVLNAGKRTTLNIRLQPQELGILMIRIQENDGKYRLTLKTETVEAARQVESNIISIREQLLATGIDIEKYEVETESPPSKNNRGNGSENREERSSREQTTGKEQKTDSETLKKTLRRLSLGTNTVDYIG